HTLRLEVAVADVGGTLVDGRNTIDFRFNYAFPKNSPDDFGAPSTGYRILGLELRRPDDTDAINGTSFAWDDPATWSAPEGYGDSESVAEGEALWKQRNSLAPHWRSDETITAACADCHATDGRDLAYFAFSNTSIIARSKFHGLSARQGKKIAAYIRSYELKDPDTGRSYAPPGRPWHPVYQPGPTSVASRSESAPRTAGTRISNMPGGGSQYAAAGAGVKWALDHDREMLAHVFPGGPSPDDFEIDSTRDGMHVPAPIQFPDWNEWLPVHHPLDMWGGEIKTWSNRRSGFWDPVEGAAGEGHRSFSDFEECASATAPSSPDCLEDLWWATRLLGAETDNFEDVESTLVEPGYTDVTSQSDAAYRQVNLEKWATVKLWETISTYDVADELSNLGTHHGGTWANSDWYTWPGGPFPFDLAPHVTGRYAGAKDRAYDLWLDNAWYELAMRINSGRGHKLGNRPVDWQYQNTHLGDLGNLGIEQPLRRVFTYMKSLEMCESFDNTIGHTEYNPRSWSTNRYICGAILGVSHDLFSRLDRYRSGLHRETFEVLFEEQVRAMMYRHSPGLGSDVDAHWDRLDGERGGWEPPSTSINTRADLNSGFWKDPGKEPSQFYHTLKLGNQIGVRPTLLDSAAAWNDAMVPSDAWDTFMCSSNGGRLECSTSSKTFLDSLVIRGSSLRLTHVGPALLRTSGEDPPTVTATSSNPPVLATSVSPPNQTVVLTPEADGNADLTLTASSKSKKVSAEPVPVTVQDDSTEDPPLERALAVIDADEGGSTGIDLGTTGLGGTLWNVRTSGSIDARFFAGADAEGTATTSSSASRSGEERFENLSQYRWEVRARRSTFDSVDVRIRLDDEDVDGIGIPEAITIVLDADGDGDYESVPTAFDDQGTPSDSTDDVLVAQGVTQLGTFKLASDSPGNPLPVDLTAFTATRDGTAALLRWQTASETNNSGFGVLHRPPDSTDYSQIGFVEGAGTTAKPHSYRFRAGDLAPGTHRFRLRQVDAGGATSRTDPVPLVIEAKQALTLRVTGPNPVRKSTRLAFTVERSGPVALTLYDVLGQRVKEIYHQKTARGKRRTAEVSVLDLSSGTYFARLGAPSGVRVRKIVVMR
ncbi:MAG: T9SS type A sorting domain-containing protein, partial [Salinibacter sp.]|uniref:T9SS type A sorting domain-containing protein n=1 Tax=Salinibacter sp. TaxID=2065818 RepID=UPI0035D494A3